MRFEKELPSASRVRENPRDWEAMKQKLIQNPNEWGLMVEDAPASTAGQLSAGKYKAFQGDDLAHFEFRVRRPEKPAEPYAAKRTDVWGRYTPVIDEEAMADYAAWKHAKLTNNYDLSVAAFNAEQEAPALAYEVGFRDAKAGKKIEDSPYRRPGSLGERPTKRVTS